MGRIIDGQFNNEEDRALAQTMQDRAEKSAIIISDIPALVRTQRWTPYTETEQRIAEYRIEAADARNEAVQMFEENRKLRAERDELEKKLAEAESKLAERGTPPKVISGRITYFSAPPGTPPSPAAVGRAVGSSGSIAYKDYKEIMEWFRGPGTSLKNISMEYTVPAPEAPPKTIHEKRREAGEARAAELNRLTRGRNKRYGGGLHDGQVSGRISR